MSNKIIPFVSHKKTDATIKKIKENPEQLFQSLGNLTIDKEDLILTKDFLVQGCATCVYEMESIVLDPLNPNGKSLYDLHLTELHYQTYSNILTIIDGEWKNGLKHPHIQITMTPLGLVFFYGELLKFSEEGVEEYKQYSLKYRERISQTFSESTISHAKNLMIEYIGEKIKLELPEFEWKKAITRARMFLNEKLWSEKNYVLIPVQSQEKAQWNFLLDHSKQLILDQTIEMLQTQVIPGNGAVGKENMDSVRFNEYQLLLIRFMADKYLEEDEDQTWIRLSYPEAVCMLNFLHYFFTDDQNLLLSKVAGTAIEKFIKHTEKSKFETIQYGIDQLKENIDIFFPKR